jgi:allophanate hydrolase
MEPARGDREERAHHLAVAAGGANASFGTGMLRCMALTDGYAASAKCRGASSRAFRWKTARRPPRSSLDRHARVCDRSRGASLSDDGGFVEETVAGLVAAHRADPAAMLDTLARAYGRIDAAADPAMFITLRPHADVLAEARALVAAGARSLPLYGIPIAVKDNIDVARIPTTAACPAFAYTPDRDAACVARLKQAGALVLGKTNLDQFATGLVGVRSPYGTPRNALSPALVSGGSSSGSAVAVARGIVPLALGTDTAGSGRVPAALNNIVGLKPSIGLLATDGVVPACRSFDCVSILALTVEDAWAALAVMREEGEGSSFAAPGPLAGPDAAPRIGVPRAADRLHFGDADAAAAFAGAIERVGTLGWSVAEVDLAAHFEAGALLYDGAFIAERWAAVGDFVEANPAAVHPVTRGIVARGQTLSAVDAFRDLYKLDALRRRAVAAVAGTDALMVPSVPTAFTVAAVLEEPVALNACLGTYTNFVNPLGMAAVAVPSALGADGTPFGVTFLTAGGSEALLVRLGAAYHAATGLKLGALAGTRAPRSQCSEGPAAGRIALAVVGAHLSGMALNGELVALGAQWLETTRTAPDYRLFALPGTSPPRPGLLRVGEGHGSQIEVELWALEPGAFGRLVAAVPAPLAIGALRLADGRSVKGFLVESEAIRGARDVSEFGGWRAAAAALQREGQACGRST